MVVVVAVKGGYVSFYFNDTFKNQLQWQVEQTKKKRERITLKPKHNKQQLDQECLAHLATERKQI